MKDKVLLKHPISLKSALPTWNMNNKKVIMRADFNIPLLNGMVTDYNDLKLQAALPTIHYILNQASMLVLLTHIGKPTAHDPQLSTRHLIPWFEKHGLQPHFVSTIHELSSIVTNGHNNKLILFENLRFFPEEKNNDIDFARQLATGIDVYVNDAFGTVHRTDSSLTLLAEQFSPHNRTIGFLVEQELSVLNRIFTTPQHPFFLFIGGKKAVDKIPLLNSLLPYLDGLFLCPALVFSFMKSMGKSTGNSSVDEESLNSCKEILIRAQELQTPIFFPEDYRIAINGNIMNTDRNYLRNNETGICTGAKTAALWQSNIIDAKTILYNGAQGFIERPETLIGMKELCDAFASSSATTVIAGGDSTAIARYIHVQPTPTIFSTGGGATIAYLSGKPLPGLMPFLKK